VLCLCARGGRLHGSRRKPLEFGHDRVRRDDRVGRAESLPYVSPASPADGCMVIEVGTL
jgi:hypothetical protein